MADDELLNRKQAAAYLCRLGCATSQGTLSNMAISGNSGGGPPFTIYRNKKRHRVTYRRRDLDEWAAKKMRRVE